MEHGSKYFGFGTGEAPDVSGYRVRLEGHQIIYTSCRRGIEGTSDGLQVFSYDAGLPQAGIDAGVGWQRLFPFEVPARVGVSCLGYAPVEGVGAVWACNTKLPHDYMGAAGRAGNVLRHAVVLPEKAFDHELGWYPVELVGNSLWRVAMPFDAVNSAEPPALLPAVALEPSGALSREAIGEWLVAEGLVYRAARLTRTVVAAMEQGRVVAVLAEPAEAARWIAAATFALPLRLAKQVSFVLSCDNVVTAGAVVCGASADAFADHMPAYVRDTCIVFDPAADEIEDRAARMGAAMREACGQREQQEARVGQEVARAHGAAASEGAEPGARFQAVVAELWYAGSSVLEQFCELCQYDLPVGFDLAQLDAAAESFGVVWQGADSVADVLCSPQGDAWLDVLVTAFGSAADPVREFEPDRPLGELVWVLAARGNFEQLVKLFRVFADRLDVEDVFGIYQQLWDFSLLECPGYSEQCLVLLAQVLEERMLAETPEPVPVPSERKVLAWVIDKIVEFEKRHFGRSRLAKNRSARNHPDKNRSARDHPAKNRSDKNRSQR